MSSVERLLRVEPDSPLLTLESNARATAEEAMGWSDAALTVRAVRGRKARTHQALFDEFSAALQFPYYFGENWSAFHECLADMDWLPLRTGVVVLVYEAAQVLVEESLGDMGVLVRAFRNASSAYGRPIDSGEWWDRPAVPFHVVLQEETPGGLERWRSAGASLTPLA